MVVCRLTKIIKKLPKLEGSLFSTYQFCMKDVVYLFIIYIFIFSPVYGMETIRGTISVKQDDNESFNVIYIINLSASTDSMRLSSINLTVGPDINDVSLSRQYTLMDSLSEDVNRNIKQNSYQLIQIPVDFSISELKAGNFANWTYDLNGIDYWDKAWYSAEIIPLVGQPLILNATGKPRFVKGGYLAEDSGSIIIRTNRYPQIEVKSPSNLQNFYINNFSKEVEIIFEYIPSDDIGLKNCTLYINNISDFSVEVQPEINSKYSFKRNSKSLGNYTWYIRCCDTEGACTNSEIRNLSIKWDSPPKIQLIDHKNTSFAVNVPVDFRCKANDDLKILGCVLYIDGDSVSNNSIIKNNECVFTHTFIGKQNIGVHEWYVQCCDNSSQCSYSSELPVHVVPPYVVYVLKYIPPDYTNIAYDKISDAVSESLPGGTIIVTPGDYFERNITIDKPLTLIGLGYPTIVGDNISNSLTIKSNNVTIQGFKIVDSNIGIYASIEDLNISYNDINISCNTILGGNYGICIDGYNNLYKINISTNAIINPLYGISLFCQDNLDPEPESFKDGITIENNSVSQCSEIGIWPTYCSRLNISNNKLNSNKYGIYAYECQSGIISSNTIIGSEKAGITRCKSNMALQSNIYKNNGKNDTMECNQ